MKLDKHIVDMFTELTKPTDDVKMEKTCYGTISVVDGTRYVKLDGSDLLVPAASTVKTSHGDRVTVLMKNHSLTITGNLTAPATDGEGGSSGEAGTAATIEVGTVTTGEAGSSASVTNSGTTSAAVFDFVIPRGDKGEKGDIGPQGPQGEKGDTGTWDGTIPDHQHAVSDITDFPTSLPANGGNADTLDGFHESKFLQNLGSWTNGAVKDLVLAATKSGYVWITNNVTGMPTAGTTWWFGILDCSNTPHRCLRVNSVSNRYRYSIVYNATEGWTDWVKDNDGGNADTVDGMHASQIMQNLNVWNSGDIKELTLAAGSGCVFINRDVTGMPIENAYYFGIVNASTMHRNLLVFQLSGLYSGYLTYNNGIGQWYGWKSFADGGNADTLDGLHANEIASNPNLFDNSNFRINQRGKSVYTENEKMCLDRWITQSPDETGGISISPTELGVHIENSGVNVGIKQAIGKGIIREGTQYTISAEINDVRYEALLTANRTTGDVVKYGNTSYYAALVFDNINSLWIAYPYVTYTAGHSIELTNVKLEVGTIATQYIPPNPAEELLKIQSMHDVGTPRLVSNNTLPAIMNSQMVSNPNLLINPDFSVNQQAGTSYSTTGYTVDCWKLFSAVSGSLGSVTVSDDGVTLTGGNNAMDAFLCQFMEDSYGNKFVGQTVTVSFEVENVTGLGICVAQYGRSESSEPFARVTGDGTYTVTGVWEPLSITNRHGLMFYNRGASSSAKIKWIKLELGEVATPFNPPDTATELAKCQRYYQIHSTNTISAVDLRPSMRITPTVTRLGSARYAYSAEL